MASKAEKFHFDRLTSAGDMDHLCPIRYVYDYLPQRIQWLKPQQIVPSSPFSNIVEKDPTLVHDDAGMNGIRLHPEAANLPLYTGLRALRQSKHWKINEKVTRELFKLFMQDQRCKDAKSTNGQSIASLAESQLKSSVLDSYVRFNIYVFPYANEKRTWLLAQAIILIFVFDGMYILLTNSGCSRYNAKAKPKLCSILLI